MASSDPCRWPQLSLYSRDQRPWTAPRGARGDPICSRYTLNLIFLTALPFQEMVVKAGLFIPAFIFQIYLVYQCFFWLWNNKWKWDKHHNPDIAVQICYYKYNMSFKHRVFIFILLGRTQIFSISPIFFLSLSFTASWGFSKRLFSLWSHVYGHKNVKNVKHAYHHFL